MTVKDFYFSTEGINLYRIYAGKDYIDDKENKIHQYVNLAYIDPNPDLNFGLYIEDLLYNAYGDKEIKYISFSIVDGRIMASIYLVEE